MIETDFTPFPEIKTQRLLLRKLENEDRQEMFFLRSDENVLQYIGKEPIVSIEEAEEFIKRMNNLLLENEAIMWGITLMENPGKVIGTICYWNFKKEHDRVELGYTLHPAFWRRGIMKEAIEAVIEYGFLKMKLHSIEALINPDNIASAAVLESTGFVKEGHIKENFYFRGNFQNTGIYSRLQ